MAGFCSFTPPPTCIDTIIKLFSKPMHLDYMILLLKKIRKKSSITLVVGTGESRGVLMLDSNTIRVIKKAGDNISLPPIIGK